MGLTPRAERYSLAAVALYRIEMRIVELNLPRVTHKSLDEFVYALVVIPKTSGRVGVWALRSVPLSARNIR